MKNIFTFIITLFVFASNIQSQAAFNTFKSDIRTIHVTGSAETTVQPDEFELRVVLQTYGKGIMKKSISDMEERFMSILEEHHIDPANLSFNSKSQQWYHWWYNRKSEQNQKAYTIKLDKSTDLLQLMKDLDIKGVKSVEITNSTNSKLQELRKQVKIEAIKAAKDKASYLLDSIDEKVGKALQVQELPNQTNLYWRGNQNFVSNVAIKSVSSDDEIDHIPVIKLKYEIQAIFEISG